MNTSKQEVEKLEAMNALADIKSRLRLHIQHLEKTKAGVIVEKPPIVITNMPENYGAWA